MVLTEYAPTLPHKIKKTNLSNKALIPYVLVFPIARTDVFYLIF